MRFSGFLVILGVVMLAPFSAQATFMDHLVAPPTPDLERPRLENGKDINHSQWNNDKWRPSDWIESRGNVDEVLNGFRTAGIITGQYEKKGQPVLEVGQGFMDLSNVDKRRVAAFIDHVYGITASAENGMFFIHHARTNKPLGIYTKYGLQIQ